MLNPKFPWTSMALVTMALWGAIALFSEKIGFVPVIAGSIIAYVFMLDIITSILGR